MTTEVLYHFFPRKTKGPIEALGILKSIFDNGLFLTKEVVPVPWKDYFGKNKNRILTIEQYRFCLTAISTREELINHSARFGHIGLEFSIDFITKLGGFPVFYVPSPRYESVDKEDYKGISLLYRIAEVQELLQYIVSNKILESQDIDIENALGAIKFLANICYPTERMIKGNQTASNYYNQREWRIIYGLTPENVIINKNESSYAIKSFNEKPIFSFINKIVLTTPSNEDELKESFLLENDIQEFVSNYPCNIKIENIIK